MSEIRPFPEAAAAELTNAQQRANLRNATETIRDKRARVVSELPDWEELREAGRGIKADVLSRLDEYLVQFEEAVTAAGATVHWARDAAEANRIVLDVARSHGVTEVVKVKSLTTDEIGLNDALAAGGVRAVETDLAELILQLDGDWSSHILVPAIHRNRTEIRDLFRRTIAGPEISDDPRELAEAARVYLREKFLDARMGVSGANFGVAETGTLVVVESEGNGRMCTTLPPVLVTILGIEKLVPTFADLEVFLQLLPRSATGERMNPYTSLWTGISDGDGPQELHVVLLDAGRTRVLADEVGRQALACIRCSACLNVCPVYSRTGGHAYGSVYPGPIGAILTPLLRGIEQAPSLPFASSLCGACYEVCPVEDRHSGRAAAPCAGSPSSRPAAAASVERDGAASAASSRQRPAGRLRAGRAGGPDRPQRPLVRRGRIGRLPRPRFPAGRERASCGRSHAQSFRQNGWAEQVSRGPRGRARARPQGDCRCERGAKPAATTGGKAPARTRRLASSSSASVSATTRRTFAASRPPLSRVRRSQRVLPRRRGALPVRPRAGAGSPGRLAPRRDRKRLSTTASTRPGSTPPRRGSPHRLHAR